MTIYDVKAAQLQSMTKASEADHDVEYTLHKARRAVVYAREDIVLVVGHLSGINEQLQTIRRLSWGLFALVAYIAYVIA